ncbi:MAG: imidazole glycerol phosphate synthase cyclase subunit [Candidatus Omnitrophota bacterium]
MRLIPRLDIKGSNLVKGIHLEGLRVLGKPENFARYYYEAGADELIYIDAVASLYERNSLIHIVERTSREIFIPLTVGGGLRTLQDIKAILRAGADKVSLNTAAVRDPQLICEASRAFGSSTIVISMEVIKRKDGTYECFTDNGRIPTGLEAVAWAKKVAELGAGEILLTAVDREGTGKGYDIELIRSVSESVSIPVIAAGGAGTVDHVLEAIVDGKADAVAMSSILHYQCIKVAKQDANEFTEGNVNFIQSGEGYSKVDTVELSDLRTFLVNRGISSAR